MHRFSGVTAVGSFSLGHWVVVLAVVLILFGAGRVPKAMGDLARGIRAFRTGLREESATELGSDQFGEGQRIDQTTVETTGHREAIPTSSTVRRDA